MQAFVRMERKLRRIRFEPYCDAEAQAMRSLGTALVGETSKIDQPNIKFLSLDFEGSTDWRYGLVELGLATVTSDQLLSDNNSGINAFNFTLKNCRRRKFLFGNTTRRSLEILGRTISDFVTELADRDSECKIILAGHSLLHDIQILDDIGISIETLPVAS